MSGNIPNKISLIRLICAIAKPATGLAQAKWAVENPDKAYNYVAIHGNLINFHENWEMSEADECEGAIKQYLRREHPDKSEMEFTELMQRLSDAREFSTLSKLMRLWTIGRYSSDSIIYL